MTRQSRARWLAFATAVLVVLLAALFTWLRNLTPAPHAATTPAAHRAEVRRDAQCGRQVRSCTVPGDSFGGADPNDANDREATPGT